MNSDFLNVYDEKAEDKDKSNVFLGRAGVGWERELFVLIRPAVFVRMGEGGGGAKQELLITLK